tara:strand:- start:1285 stop:1533 length:249 start_codon:yes stop_codon:yes gene_type:complete
MLFDVQEKLYAYDTFPKTKYLLYVNNVIAYSFVTTSKSEDDAIEILKELVKNYTRRNTMAYKIKKIEDNVEIIIYKGSIKGY